MRAFWASGLVITWAAAIGAAEPAGKLVRETWDAAFLDGEKAGHFRTTVTELPGKDGPILRVRRELRLTVKRFGDVARIQAEVGNDETPNGQLLGVFMSQGLGTDQQLRLSGRVENGVLKDAIEGPRVPGSKVEREIPLPKDLITLLGEESFIKQRNPRPGDKMSYRLFEPTVNNVIRVDVEVKGYEQVPLDGANRKLLRVTASPEKIQGVQLPSQTIWYDGGFQPVISQGEIPGLGELTLRRTTKEQALAPLGKLRDLGEQSVVLDRSITDPHRRNRIVYRVTFNQKFDDPQKEAAALSELRQKAFALDSTRQTVHEGEGRSLELHVTAVRKPPEKEGGEIVPKEYRMSNFFINSADEKVQELASEAAGHTNDPWRKAQAIERWVKNNMKPVAFTEAMATADHVARTLRGDCTEFAMLAAAMCRAQGVPSRTAIGLVYYSDRGVPKLGYHMWTEVHVRGDWVAIDATLGYGSVGPGHVKITDHSWDGVRSMVPLLPVMQVMVAKPRMEVLKVD